MKIKRAACVPLITHDPYFSIWSAADRLWERDTTHWSDLPQTITGRLVVDGKKYAFLGLPHGNPAMPQISLDITPLSTEYVFENKIARLTVRFTSPLMLDDPLLVSRPCTYVDFSLDLHEGKEAFIELTVSDDVVCRDGRKTVSRTMDCPARGIRPAFRCINLGAASQRPLCHSGDRITIDWGYVYMASQMAGAGFTYDENRQKITACVPFADGACSLILAYDDLLSVNYMGQFRKAYWTNTYDTVLDAIGAAFADRKETLAKAAEFDRDLVARAQKWGGGEYAALCCMSYRQAVSAHKLITDEQGNLLFLSKENDSNGCIGTVDVSYPSIPLFMLYNTEYVKGMMRPIFAFADTDVWEYDFAPHDMGRYPYAWGQVYGCRNPISGCSAEDVFPPFCQYPSGSDLFDFHMQMPVEECGNMLLMTAAVCIADGNADFARPYLDTLKLWVAYLEKYGADPGEQLCTDDFAGHLSHNTNLSVKAILGIEAYARILDMLNRAEEAKPFHETAKSMATDWEVRAADGDHYALAFGNADSWSLKYNLIWDQLLGSHLFSEDVFKKEIACYVRNANVYGTPLDSRRSYTKSDWIVWCAAMAESKEDAAALIRPVSAYVQDSASRVPFSDWYDTEGGCSCAFRGRSVQGGIFMPLLAERGLAAE